MSVHANEKTPISLWMFGYAPVWMRNLAHSPSDATWIALVPYGVDYRYMENELSRGMFCGVDEVERCDTPVGWVLIGYTYED